jgi:hypothetical protein
MKPYFFSALRTTVGTLFSVAAALGLAYFFSARPGTNFVPLAFAVVLIFLAWRFGAAVSLIGSLLAAFIFARFPAHRFHVADSAGSNSLVWMILLAVAGSYLLFPPQRHINETATHADPEPRTRQQG